MSDQAARLRELVRPGVIPADEHPVRSACLTLVLASGKGGVGTSNLALNLSLALGRLGKRVTLVDADLGRANLDLIAGVSPSHDLGSLLDSGTPLERGLVPITGTDECPVRLLAGAHGVRTPEALLDDAPALVMAELESVQAQSDLCLIDAGSGLDGPACWMSVAAGGAAVLVVTPEPTALADGHALVARLRDQQRGGDPPARLYVLVNQANSASEAADTLARFRAASRAFLGVAIQPLGWVPADAHVPSAVRRRRPFLTEFPRCAASRRVRRVAQSLSRLAEEASGATAVTGSRQGWGWPLGRLRARRPEMGRRPEEAGCSGCNSQAGSTGQPIKPIKAMFLGSRGV